MTTDVPRHLRDAHEFTRGQSLSEAPYARLVEFMDWTVRERPRPCPSSVGRGLPAATSNRPSTSGAPRGSSNLFRRIRHQIIRDRRTSRGHARRNRPVAQLPAREEESQGPSL